MWIVKAGADELAFIDFEAGSQFRDEWNADHPGEPEASLRMALFVATDFIDVEPGERIESFCIPQRVMRRFAGFAEKYIVDPSSLVSAMLLQISTSYQKDPRGMIANFELAMSKPEKPEKKPKQAVAQAVGASVGATL